MNTPDRRVDDEDILDALAALGPEAHRLVAQLRARHAPGRRPNPEANYRKLESHWKCFRRLNSNVGKEIAAKRFLRIKGKEIERLLGLKPRTAGALRNAVCRGKKESARVRDRRRRDWRLAFTSLADAVHGRHQRIMTDPAERAYLMAAQRAALLGGDEGLGRYISRDP